MDVVKRKHVPVSMFRDRFNFRGKMRFKDYVTDFKVCSKSHATCMITNSIQFSSHSLLSSLTKVYYKSLSYK